MCLQDHGIDDDGGSVGKVRQACGLSDNNRGVGRGHGIYYASKGLETTTEVAWGRRRV